MASLTCSRLSAAPNAVRSQRSRARTVVVKALTVQEASDWIAKGFVKIFSPPETNVQNWPTNSFSGKIDHSGRRPFKDGYTSNAPLPPSSSMEREEDGATGYVEDAVKGAVAGLKPSLESEPEWSGATTAWKGDIHKSSNKRDAREGFHAKKL